MVPLSNFPFSNIVNYVIFYIFFWKEFFDNFDFPLVRKASLIVLWIDLLKNDFISVWTTKLVIRG